MHKPTESPAPRQLWLVTKQAGVELIADAVPSESLAFTGRPFFSFTCKVTGSRQTVELHTSVNPLDADGLYETEYLAWKAAAAMSEEWLDHFRRSLVRAENALKTFCEECHQKECQCPEEEA